ncbi:MAG: hypothetical protein OEW90_01955 [Betaproteobacteria bacterium]|nr:hypothetical protein [Betaproteobacteria bacterium]
MVAFEVLPGLPPYGPMAKSFSETGQGTHREGFVVRFGVDQTEPWVGNFQPGLTEFSGAYAHPDERHVVVVSGGDVYVVDPESRNAVAEFGGMVNSVLAIAGERALLFEETLWLRLLTAEGIRWKTKRISWDGIRNLSVVDDAIIGEAWSIEDTWHPFKVDISSGRVEGGAYNGPEP